MVVEVGSARIEVPLLRDPDPVASVSTSRVHSDRMVEAWREGIRTRAQELRALNEWMRDQSDGAARNEPGKILVVHDAVVRHLDAALSATQVTAWWRRNHTGARMQAAMSNLDAAELSLLRAAPACHFLGQMPSLLNEVQRHLKPHDARRKEVESIIKTLKAHGADHNQPDVPDPRLVLIEAERATLVSALRGARSAALREQNQLRSIRNLIVATSVGMTVVAIALGVIGWRAPAVIPLCFAPEVSGQTTVVCPTEQKGPIVLDPASGGGDIDEAIDETATSYDIALVELIGSTQRRSPPRERSDEYAVHRSRTASRSRSPFSSCRPEP